MENGNIQVSYQNTFIFICFVIPLCEIRAYYFIFLKCISNQHVCIIISELLGSKSADIVSDSQGVASSIKDWDIFSHHEIF